MTPDDDELIRRCLKGDEAAFTVLMHRHEERLFNTVYRIIGNVEDAQDVVQNTFITAFQTLASFDPQAAAFFTWLYRIAFNIIVSNRRAQGCSAARRQREFAYAALQQLPPKLGFVLFLKDVAGCNYAAIAEFLESPVGTIRSMIHQARLELKQLLETAAASDAPLFAASQTDVCLAAAAGDMEAFCSLIMRYARHLEDMVRELAPDPSLLVIAVLQRLAAFTGKSPFVTWLHQLVIEVAKRK